MDHWKVSINIISAKNAGRFSGYTDWNIFAFCEKCFIKFQTEKKSTEFGYNALIWHNEWLYKGKFKYECKYFLL